MRRLAHETDGAIAVMVGIMLVVLLGFGAIAVDAGALFAERRQLQNGADAAVLAVAQDCASGDSIGACDSGPQGDRLATARTFADSNAEDGSADVPGDGSGVVIDYAAGRATVATRSLNAGEGFVRHWFAPLIGTDSTQVVAASTAIWGPVAFGSFATLPLTFSQCEYNLFLAAGAGTASAPWTAANNGAPQKIAFQGGTPKQPTPECNAGPAGQDLPGGFGWLNDVTGSSDKTACETLFTNNTATASTGASSPCDKQWLEDNVLNQVIFLPVFSDAAKDGKSYTFASYAAFYVTGYSFPGANAPDSKGPCPNPEPNCIAGWFTTGTVLDGVVDPTAPDTGVRTVQLVPNP